MSDFVNNVVDNAATIIASANSPALVRPVSEQGKPGTVVMLVNVGSNPTGTNPTLDFQLQSSLDGATWNNVGASQQFTVAGNARVEAKAVETQWRIKKTIGGTAVPTFTNVTSNLLFM